MSTSTSKRMKLGTAISDVPPKGPYPYPRGTMNEQHVDLDKGGIHILIKEFGVVNRTACQHCIGGHRVKGCKHIYRVLRNAKRAGRPLTHCDHTVDCREACTEDATFVCLEPPEYYELSNGLPVRVAEYRGQERKQLKSGHKSSKSTGSAKVSKDKGRAADKGLSPSSNIPSISPRSLALPGQFSLPQPNDLCLPLASASGSSCASSGCQCGPTCACIGCKIHGNTVPSNESANPCACQTCQCYSELVVHAPAAPEHDSRRQRASPSKASGGCCSSKKSSSPKASSASHRAQPVGYTNIRPARLASIDTSHHHQQYIPPTQGYYHSSHLGMPLPQYSLGLPENIQAQLHNPPFSFPAQYVPTPSTAMTPSFLPGEGLPTESLAGADFDYVSPYDISDPDNSIFDAHFRQYDDGLFPEFSDFRAAEGQPQVLADGEVADQGPTLHGHTQPALKEEEEQTCEKSAPRSGGCCGKRAAQGSCHAP